MGKEKSSVRIESKDKAGSDIGIIRGSGIVNFPVKEVLEVLWEERHKEKMEAMTEKYETLETVNDNCRVRYTVQNPPIVTRRFTCYLLNRLECENGAIMLSFSINHENCPDENHVLSTVHLLGFHIKKLTDASCQIGFIGDIDPGGWLPGSLKRRLANEMPLKIDDV